MDYGSAATTANFNGRIDQRAVILLPNMVPSFGRLSSLMLCTVEAPRIIYRAFRALSYSLIITQAYAGFQPGPARARICRAFSPVELLEGQRPDRY